jgi:phosphoglycerate-specific signal transduction histidine kinase
MKPTENYEQLIERFNKRTNQLKIRREQLQPMYSEYVQIEKDLERLQGSLQAVEYLAFGKLPGDGNHDGMKNHMPRM